MEGGAEEAEGAAPGGAGLGCGDSGPPQNFAAARGPRPYLQRRRRPRARGAGGSSGRGAPPSGGHGSGPGSGSGSARARLGLRLPRRGCSRRGGRRRARLRPRRLAAAGAEAAAAGPPAAGAATPAPGEEPRAPPLPAPEVLARRSGRSCSHPGPASSGSPHLTRPGTRSVPTGTLRPGGERDTPRSPRPAA